MNDKNIANNLVDEQSTPASPKIKAGTSTEAPAVSTTTDKPYSIVQSVIRSREASRCAEDIPEKARHPGVFRVSTPSVDDISSHVSREQSQTLWQGLGLLVLILAFLPIFTLMIRSDPPAVEPAKVSKFSDIRDGKDDIQAPAQTPKGFRMNRMCRIDGKIDSVENANVVHITADGRKFRVEFIATMPIFLGGELVEAELIPIRNLKTGEIDAKGHRLTVIK